MVSSLVRQWEEEAGGGDGADGVGDDPRDQEERVRRRQGKPKFFQLGRKLCT